MCLTIKLHMNFKRLGSHVIKNNYNKWALNPVTEWLIFCNVAS